VACSPVPLLGVEESWRRAAASDEGKILGLVRNYIPSYKWVIDGRSYDLEARRSARQPPAA
jgi:hypothetical protein